MAGNDFVALQFCGRIKPQCHKTQMCVCVRVCVCVCAHAQVLVGRLIVLCNCCCCLKEKKRKEKKDYKYDYRSANIYNQIHKACNPCYGGLKLP